MSGDAVLGTASSTSTPGPMPRTKWGRRLSGWLWPLAGLAVTATWVVLATQDQPTERAAAAAAAALITVAVVPTTLESLLAAVVLLGVFPMAMTRPVTLAAATVAVAVIELAVDRQGHRAVRVGGAVLVAGSVALSGVTAAVLALGGAFVLLLGRSPHLMVPGLLTAWLAVDALADTPTAIVVGLAAVVLAGLDRPGAAIAALGLVGHPLLLAGVLVRHPLAAVALVPGAVATVDQEIPALALLAVAAVTAWRARPLPLERRDAPALVLLAWLAVAPSTWRWAGSPDLAEYERGVALAVATGALAAVATTLVRLRHGTSSSTS